VQARWLIEAKFVRPVPVRGQVERAQILDRLASAPSRLVVAQAAAGFGKSTLLAQWTERLDREGTLVAWLNLDEDDRQAEPFVTYLAEAIRRALAPVSSDGAAALAGHAGLPVKAALAAIFTELARRGKRIALILDDYHRAESEEVDAVMKLVIDRAPDCVSLALASRTLPRLGIARLKADMRAVIVADHDLRFGDDETSLFFAREEARLDHSDWARFRMRAEGWPVALQFARMWLRDGGSLSALSAASEANDLGSYLSEQVFGTLPPDQQDFLIRTGPLEEVSEELAAAVGVAAPAPRIKEVMASALPVVILSQQPFRFRYHHLLRDYLVSRAAASAIDLRDVHRQAAAWFESAGDLGSAIRHALAGKDAHMAAAIVEKSGGWRLVYRGHGHLGTILRTVHATAGASAKAFPRLTLGAVVVSLKRGDVATAATLFSDLASRIADEKDELADDLVVIDALVKLYSDAPMPEPGLARLTTLVRRMEDEDAMTRALAANLVAYFTLQRGSFVQAKRFGEQAIRNFTEADALFGALHLHAHIGQAELAMGDTAAAAASYRTMHDACSRLLGEDADLAAIASVLAAEAAYQSRDLTRARRLIASALTRIESGDGWFDVFAAGYLTAARLDFNDHGPAAALAAIERGRSFARGRSMRRLTGLLGEEAIRVATLSKDLDGALRACREAGLSLAVTDAGLAAPPVSSLRGDGHALIAARLLLALGRGEDALAFLEVADAQAQRGGAPLTRRITARVLRALAEGRRGRREPTLSLLSVATGLAGPEKLSRTLLDEGEPFRRLARAVRDDGAADPALRERLRLLLDPRVVRDRPARPPDDFGLSAREREVLDLVAQGLSNKEIGRRIGRDPNTVKYHLKRVFAKMSAANRMSAVSRARAAGLLS
jgi:LuxR family maltose regulon positive regulatory protein